MSGEAAGVQHPGRTAPAALRTRPEDGGRDEAGENGGRGDPLPAPAGLRAGGCAAPSGGLDQVATFHHGALPNEVGGDGFATASGSAIRIDAPRPRRSIDRNSSVSAGRGGFGSTAADGPAKRSRTRGAGSKNALRDSPARIRRRPQPTEIRFRRRLDG